MPCQDITETIRIALTADDRLADYSFIKRACGGNIGQKSLLLDSLRGKSIDEINAIDQAALIEQMKPRAESEYFLIMKHLSVIQFCLLVYYGKKELNSKNTVRFYSINHGEDSTELEADVKLRLDVEKIDPCNACGCSM